MQIDINFPKQEVLIHGLTTGFIVDKIDNKYRVEYIIGNRTITKSFYEGELRFVTAKKD